MSRRRTAADPTRAIGYVRVSTDEQALGPEAQRAALAAWARAHGAALVAVHEDVVSGGAPLDRRPALLAALDDLRARGAGVLLVAKRDRLARDVMVAAMVERLAERAGARVLAADGTGNGDGPEALLLRGIVNVFAEYERALIRARTRAALAVKRARGEKTGGAAPYGFRAVAGRLERDEAEARLVAEVRALRAGGCTLRDVGAELEARGYRPRAGERWHPAQIARILARPAAAAVA